MYGRFSGQGIDVVAREGYEHLAAARADSAMVRFAALQNIPDQGATAAQQAGAAGWMCRAADLLTTAGSDYAQAYEYLLSARELAVAAGCDSLVGEVDFRLAGINYIFLDYDKSHRMMAECFDRAANAGQYNMVLKTLSNLITTAFVAPDGYKALRPQLERFDSLPMPRTERRQFVSDFRDALRYCDSGDFGDALHSLDHAAAHIDSSWDDGQSRYVLASLKAVIYRTIGKNRDAMECVRSFGRGTPENAYRYYHGLWKCYQALGMKDSAQYFLGRKLALQDSVFNVGRYGSLRTMETRVKMDRAARDYHVLQIKSNMHLTLFWVAVLFLLVVAAMSTRLYFQHRRLLARNMELYRQYIDRRDNEERLMKMLQSASETEKPKYATSSLGEAQKADIVARCRKTLEETEEVFNPDFRLDTLAEMTGLPKHHVSQALNDTLGQNFGSFVAEVRVRRACAMLTDADTKRTLTIEAIASAVGFRSRSHFVTVFKRVTGLTPTDYQKAASNS